MNWKSSLQQSFEKNTDMILQKLDGETEVSFYLEAEESEFVRFSKGQVRQATAVDQAEVNLTIKTKTKTSKISFPMTGVMAEDRQRFLLYFGKIQKELEALPENPFPIQFASSGQSFTNKEGQTPNAEFIIDKVKADASKDDFVGYLASGPIVRAVKNSKGTYHWYSTDLYFVDYSLFEGQQAVTANVAGSRWVEADWQNSLSESRAFLDQMRKPKKVLPRGEYKAYLAPSAVSELVSTASWGGFSQHAFQVGQCGLKQVFDGTKKLSSMITLKEDFTLGLCQPFSSNGELAENTVTLIHQGVGEKLLTCSKSAVEYKVTSTGANDWEHAQTLDLAKGQLSKEKIFKEIGTGLYLSNLHYVNWSDRQSARMTGMTRFACFWVENGDIVGPLQDMRFDISLYDLWGSQLLALTDFQETSVNNLTYIKRGLGGTRLPGALVDGFRLTL